MRLEIDTPSDGVPVNSEGRVGLLEADREDNCAWIFNLVRRCFLFFFVP